MRTATTFLRSMARAAASVAVALAAACAVGPDYQRPAVPAPAAYKEQPPAEGSTVASDWKSAAPRDDARRGKWWELFGDSELNALEEQVEVSNQTLAQAVAQYRGARAAARFARGDLFPAITTDRKSVV